MTNESIIQVLGVVKTFCTEHSAALSDFDSIAKLNIAREEILRITDRNRAVTLAAYELMVEIRKLHASHRGAHRKLMNIFLGEESP